MNVQLANVRDMALPVLAGVLAVGFFGSLPAADGVSVKCHNGTFVGVCDGNGIRAFKGIPYAVQPTGGLRWKRTTLAADDAGTFPAEAFGPSCPQALKPGAIAAEKSAQMDEACLVLNVWSTDPSRLAADRRTGRPVMVYVHGGDFSQGTSADPMLDGAHFVRRHPDIVMVTVNYRLNLVGFADFSALADGADHKKADYPDTGRLGFLDQQVALRWVQKNIAAFGGDPANVTIFGESAGGGFVAFHLMSAESQPLFNRAIMMSGVPDLTQTREGQRARNQSVGLVKGLRKLLGKEAVTLDDLLALDRGQLLELLTTEVDVGLPPDLISGLNTAVGNLYCRPLRDDAAGAVVSDPFAAFATNGLAGAKDLIVGTMADEDRCWPLLQAEASYGDYRGDKADPLRAYYGGVMREHLRETLEWYGSASNDVLSALAKIPRDRDAVDAKYPGIWRVQKLTSFLNFYVQNARFARTYAAGQATNGRRTYAYRFEHPAKLAFAPWVRACHGVDIPYAFGNADCGKFGKLDESVAARFSAAFAAFARTGDPTADGAPAWPEYKGAEHPTLRVAEGGEMVAAPRLDDEIIDLLLPGYGRYEKARASAVRTRPFFVDTAFRAE